MKNNHEDVVRHRLKQAKTSDGWESFHRKVYDLRRLVAGDYSSMININSSAASDDENQGKTSSNLDLYDFIILSPADGHSNKLLQTVKTLTMQTGYYFPEIEFDNLSPRTATLNIEYCKKRLGDVPNGCGAKDHMRMALLDYLISGIGWIKAGIREERTIIQYCDTLDMTWDRTVQLPTDIRWASCKYREPLYVWVDMFGSEPFQSRITDNDEVSLEDVVELEFYYDVEDEGHYYVFDCHHEEVIHSEINPYFFQNGNTRTPYLPYEPMYLLQLPSLRMPIGLVEQMLPNQISVWESEANIKTTLQRAAPFYTIIEGALNDEEKQKFEDGDIGTIVEVRKDSGGINANQGIAISQDIIRWRELNNLEIISQGGANPYATGAPVEGVSYAAEVNAIQGNSGLMAGNIAKDLAAFWQRVVRKFLAAAKLYDDRPITVLIEGTDLPFDEFNPIKRFLRPDADVLVRESTMLFKTQTQKIQEALLKLQTSQAMAQLFPNAPRLAFLDYLTETGEKSLEKWMEVGPTMIPTPAGAQPGMMQEPAGMGAGSMDMGSMMNMAMNQ